MMGKYSVLMACCVVLSSGCKVKENVYQRELRYRGDVSNREWLNMLD